MSDREDVQRTDTDRETEPLLTRENTSNGSHFMTLTRSRKLLVTVLVILGLVMIGTTLGIVLQFYLFPNCPDIPDATDQINIKLLSLSVWGSPASFGVLDKEERMKAIGEYLSNNSYDVVLLQELWMRPDHETIRSYLPEGLRMSDVGDLAPAVCDGRAAPTFCSGLALITSHPVKDFSFTSFSVHGNFWRSDGEFWARKGIGRVKLEPAANFSVEILLTSLCASDDNSYYRQIQATEFAGGNFEVDPRTSETTYRDVTKHIQDTKSRYFGGKWLSKRLATYGNYQNSYSSKYSPLVYDYLLHKAGKNNKITIKKVEIPILKTKGGKSLSNHEASVAEYTLSKM